MITILPLGEKKISFRSTGLTCRWAQDINEFRTCGFGPTPDLPNTAWAVFWLQQRVFWGHVSGKKKWLLISRRVLLLGLELGLELDIFTPYKGREAPADGLVNLAFFFQWAVWGLGRPSQLPALGAPPPWSTGAQLQSGLESWDSPNQQVWIPLDFGIHGDSWNGTPVEGKGKSVVSSRILLIHESLLAVDIIDVRVSWIRVSTMETSVLNYSIQTSS